VKVLEHTKKIWEAFINFLVTYDSHKISELIQKLKWEEVVKNPYLWLIGLPILGVLLVRKSYRILILIFSLAAFLYLVQITFPPSAHTIPLEKLLRFIGGCIFLGLLNLYFLFVRTD
jgi:hypothetical protein